MSSTETLLAALLVIFAVPFLVWRLGRTERYVPLVVIQMLVRM